MAKKVIAVMGATGSQGSGLVKAIMADKSGEYTARAITRDVNSDKAKALAALGAEVVAADIDNEESLKKAFAGAHGAYCVTFFWAHFSPEKEQAQARAMAEAAIPDFSLGALAQSGEETSLLHDSLVTTWDPGDEAGRAAVTAAYNGLNGTIAWAKRMLADESDNATGLLVRNY